MNTKFQNIIIFVLCILFCIIYTISITQQINEMNRTISNIQEKNKFLKHTLNKNIEYASIINKSEKLFKPNTLIYRYCDESCEKCVREDLFNIKKLQKEIGKEHILIIASFPDNRNTKIRLKYELDSLNYQRIDSKEDMPINNLTGSPERYFIYWGEDETKYFIFFPTILQSDLTTDYFNLIKNYEKVHKCKIENSK